MGGGVKGILVALVKENVIITVVLLAINLI
jgi:hypothetical protein